MGLETCYDGPLECYQPFLQPTSYWIGSISSPWWKMIWVYLKIRYINTSFHPMLSGSFSHLKGLCWGPFSDTDTHTHPLAQKHLCEFWCGMHRTCKNTSVKPDRRYWMTRSERLCEENLSMSLLKEWNCSDAAHSSSIEIGKSDCENRTGIEVTSSGKLKVWKENCLKNCLKHDMPVLGLAGCHWREMENSGRYADWRPNLYHQIKWASSLVAVPNDLPLPPADSLCKFNKSQTGWKFYIFSDVSHTHRRTHLGLSEKGYLLSSTECWLFRCTTSHISMFWGARSTRIVHWNVLIWVYPE